MMNGILSKEDYAELYDINVESQFRLTNILNRNGCANWTVCPECGVDDFCHIEGCGMDWYNS